MAMINRISRLFRADFNFILDQIEEPEQLLRQAVRDMEEDLATCERRIKCALHEQGILSAREKELEEALASINEQLSFCFDSGKDDLARSLVRKKLEASRMLQRLQSRRTDNARQIEAQKATLSENQATLESLRQKADLFAQQCPAQGGHVAEPGDLAWSAREMAIPDEEVEIAYLREKSLRQSTDGRSS